MDTEKYADVGERPEAAEPLTFTVGLIVETVLADRVEHDGWRITPLEFRDATYAVAINVVFALEPRLAAIQMDEAAAPVIDAVVISVLQPAADVEEAIEAARERLVRLADALGFRQMGQGRYLAFVAWGAGELAAEMPYVHRAAIAQELLEGQSHTEEISYFAAALADERGAALARLFLDALRDPSTTGSLARLWSLLETLAEHFPGSKKAKVIAAVRHIGIAGGADFDRAYKLRNNFVHRGLTGDPAEVELIRDDLAFTAHTVLARSRFKPVDRNERPWAERNPNPPIRKVRIRTPRRQPQ